MPKRKPLTYGKRLMVAARQEYRCHMCQETLGARFTIDHWIALCLGGADELSNLVALCGTCNDTKTAMDMQKYWDRRREERTGTSRFFDPHSVEYACGNLDTFFKQFYFKSSLQQQADGATPKS